MKRPQQEEQVAFQNDDDEQDLSLSSGVKFNTNKTQFKNHTKNLPDIKKLAKDIEQNKLDKNRLAFELGQKFIQLLNDQTLVSNKGPKILDYEKQVCSQLFLLAQELNNSPNENEAAGSLVLETLFFKALLKQRDRLNELEYSLAEEVDKIKKHLKISE